MARSEAAQRVTEFVARRGNRGGPIAVAGTAPSRGPSARLTYEDLCEILIMAQAFEDLGGDPETAQRVLEAPLPLLRGSRTDYVDAEQGR